MKFKSQISEELEFYMKFYTIENFLLYGMACVRMYVHSTTYTQLII